MNVVVFSGLEIIKIDVIMDTYAVLSFYLDSSFPYYYNALEAPPRAPLCV